MKVSYKTQSVLHKPVCKNRMQICVRSKIQEIFASFCGVSPAAWMIGMNVIIFGCIIFFHELHSVCLALSGWFPLCCKSHMFLCWKDKHDIMMLGWFPHKLHHSPLRYALSKNLGEPIASERFCVGGHNWVSAVTFCLTQVWFWWSKVLHSLNNHTDYIHSLCNVCACLWFTNVCLNTSQAFYTQTVISSFTRHSIAFPPFDTPTITSTYIIYPHCASQHTRSIYSEVIQTSQQLQFLIPHFTLLHAQHAQVLLCCLDGKRGMSTEAIQRRLEAAGLLAEVIAGGAGSAAAAAKRQQILDAGRGAQLIHRANVEDDALVAATAAPPSTSGTAVKVGGRVDILSSVPLDVTKRHGAQCTMSARKSHVYAVINATKCSSDCVVCADSYAWHWQHVFERLNV